MSPSAASGLPPLGTITVGTERARVVVFVEERFADKSAMNPAPKKTAPLGWAPPAATGKALPVVARATYTSPEDASKARVLARSGPLPKLPRYVAWLTAVNVSFNRATNASLLSPPRRLVCIPPAVNGKSSEAVSPATYISPDV